MKAEHILGTTVLAVVVAATPAALGGNFWQCSPDVTGDWFVEDNWTGGVPDCLDYTHIENGGTVEISAGDAAASCR